MSNTFSFRRLKMLVAKQFFENTRLYIFSILALLGLQALFFGLWFMSSGPNYGAHSIYLMSLFGLFISGAIFASMAFNMLGSKDKGIYWLGIPATHLEKLVCTIFYTTIVFSVVYWLTFIAVKEVTLLFLNGFIKDHPGTSFEEIKNPDEFWTVFRYFVYAFYAVQALYLLGSVYFSRYSFVITTVVGAAFVFSTLYFLNVVEDAVLDGGAWDIVSFSKYDYNGIKKYTLSPFITDVLTYSLKFIWVPVFWVTTWFRLKEKQM